MLNGIRRAPRTDCAKPGSSPSLNSAAQLAAWRAAGAQAGRSIAGRASRSTAACRGSAWRQPRSRASLADADAFDGIDLRLVMSHLACADEPDNPANEAQRAGLRDAARASCRTRRRRSPIRPASFSDRAFHYDLARPGAALYGVNPTPGRTNPMRRWCGWRPRSSRPAQLECRRRRRLRPRFPRNGPLRLATIALGYADGWQRRAASAAWFKGIQLPFAGRVSMDSIILDISALPAGTAAARRPGRTDRRPSDASTTWPRMPARSATKY